MESIQFPDIIPTAALKNKVATLEETAYSQHSLNKKINETFGELSQELIGAEDILRNAILSLQEKFDRELIALRKEYEHRF